MEDILTGIIKFFGNTITDIIYSLKTKTGILVGFIIALICFVILYILITYF
jgi:hypothetical protein